LISGCVLKGRRNRPEKKTHGRKYRRKNRGCFSFPLGSHQEGGKWGYERGNSLRRMGEGGGNLTIGKTWGGKKKKRTTLNNPHYSQGTSERLNKPEHCRQGKRNPAVGDELADTTQPLGHLDVTGPFSPLLPVDASSKKEMGSL